MNLEYRDRYLTLDWDDIDRDACIHRMQAILEDYSNVKELLFRQSPSKSGWHIRVILHANTNVPLMRFKLQDDPRRLLHDIFNRADYVHDVLWDRKTIQGKTFNASEWERYHE